ncbi:MAG TPA: hypothetical protein PLB79_00865, partial [Thermotogota bacterium]|nr:hypothetical protein [Thermotogota bacterium]
MKQNHRINAARNCYHKPSLYRKTREKESDHTGDIGNKIVNDRIALQKYGASDRNRTRDLLITS